MTKKNAFAMNRPILTAVAAAALVACATRAGSDGEPTSTSLSHLEDGSGELNWWQQERAQRQAEVDAYVAAHRDDFDSFRRVPAGNVGVPMIVFRLFPELFPELWGPPSDNFATVGFGPDTFEPSRVLPIGLGYAGMDPAIQTPVGPVKMNAVQVTCMACHSGRVQDASGAMRPLIGAPNTEFQFNRFRALTVATVNSPGFTADRFVSAILAKSPGWLYGDPAMAMQEKLETGIFLANPDAVLKSLRDGTNAGVARVQATLMATTYARPDAPNINGRTPGSMDAFGQFTTMVVDPAQFPSKDAMASVMPPAPALSDFMPLWRQADRSSSKWGGDVVSATHANAGAAMGMVGTPYAVDMNNVNAATRFSKELPPAPYPFDVVRSAVARGQSIFQQSCASCHAPGNANILSPSQTGTDPNRANVLTPYTTAGLVAAIRIACNDPTTCTNNGAPLPDDQLLRMTRGYAAVPLAGIWARAPYLHNGSVPTLRALLTNDRPTTFYRGNTTYDTKNVGFVWATADGPNAALFDTTRAGNSNAGHTGAAYGDFSQRPGDVDDLLEYLKTL